MLAPDDIPGSGMLISFNFVYLHHHPRFSVLSVFGFCPLLYLGMRLDREYSSLRR